MELAYHGERQLGPRDLTRWAVGVNASVLNLYSKATRVRF